MSYAERWIACLAIALASPFGFPTVSFAQRTTGDITGTVSDATGGVLPGVSVTAVCTDTRSHAAPSLSAPVLVETLVAALDAVRLVQDPLTAHI